MSRVLVLASVASMIEQFNMDNIDLLQNMKFDVDVVANFENGSPLAQDRVKEFKKKLEKSSICAYNIPIPRSIFKVKNILTSYKMVKDLCKKQKYQMIHCHSPIGGVVARIAANKFRKKGTKVIYTAHGFHFFKGAPLKNWLLYFPIEWLCSFMTDVLITINQEDYNFAKKYMHAKKVEYVPGVGVDTQKISNNIVDWEEKRKELEISNDAKLLFSVGELSIRKNHEVILRAIARLKRNDIDFVICGIGKEKKRLEYLAEELGISKNLHLLGFRNDIFEICKISNVFCFPSLQEGLPVALMEAMASGLPIICSNIRGNNDLIEEGKGGFLCSPDDVEGFAKNIKKLVENEELSNSMGLHNANIIKKYDIKNVRLYMERIYKNVIL